MTEEIRYNKDEKWIPYKQLAETPQQTIGRLEQENKQMKSALEEISITVKQLLQGVSSNCINNTPYLTALSLIEDKINEVLGE